MEESPGVRLYQMAQVVDEIQEVPAGEKFHDQVKTGRRLEDGEKFDLSEGEDVNIKSIYMYIVYIRSGVCWREGGQFLYIHVHDRYDIIFHNNYLNCFKIPPKYKDRDTNEMHR